MKPEMVTKMCVDISMTIALLLLMAYQLIGEEAHEWIGMIMFVLFVCHHILNRKWSSNLWKGRYTARRSCQTLLVFLILICMVGSMVSGIILSRYVFRFMNIRGGAATARQIHMLCAYWGFVLMSVHLGFHWNMIMAMAGKAFPDAWYKSAMFLRGIAVIIAGYGMFAFHKRDIWNYMILRNHFAFYDFSEPVVFFLLDYLAVMGLFVFAGHYFGKSLLKVKKKEKV